MDRKILRLKKDVVIIAGGPSLRSVGISQLRDCDATFITINGVTAYLPWADYCFTSDCRDLAQRYNSYTGFRGQKIAAVPDGYKHRLPDDTLFYRRIPWQPSISWNKPEIRTGNSALGAYEMCVKHAAELEQEIRVFLFGVDMTRPGYHFYDNKRAGDPEDAFDLTLFRWTDMTQIFPTFNCNPDSALQAYPLIDPHKAFRMMDRKKHE